MRSRTTREHKVATSSRPTHRRSRRPPRRSTEGDDLTAHRHAGQHLRGGVVRREARTCGRGCVPLARDLQPDGLLRGRKLRPDTITLSNTNDRDDNDSDHSVTITLAAGDSYTVGTANSVAVTIRGRRQRARRAGDYLHHAGQDRADARRLEPAGRPGHARRR